MTRIQARTRKRAIHPAERTAGVLLGLLTAATAVGTGELVAAFTGAATAPELAVGTAVINLAPESVRLWAIRTFGTNDKPMLVDGVLAALAVLGIVAGLVALRHRRIAAALVVAMAAVGVAAAATAPSARGTDVLPSVCAGVVGVAALFLLFGAYERRHGVVETAPPAEPDATSITDVPSDKGSDEPSGPRTPLRDEESDATSTPAIPATPAAVDRRRVLLATGGAVVFAAATGITGRVLQSRLGSASASRAAVRLPPPTSPAPPPPPGADFGIPGLAPYVTSNRDFYRVDTALALPQVTTDQWSLTLHGMVDHPMTFSYDDILRMPLEEHYVTLSCVSNDVGGNLVGNARWLGVPLASLLRSAGVSAGADQILSTSTDGMTIGTPTEIVLDGREALLAIAMNGEPLPIEHGFPARLIVPGLYGYASATKWVTDLELTTFSRATAYWVQQGYSRQGVVKIASRIDLPSVTSRPSAGPVQVAGVAYAQHRGISAVQVRVDGGPWQDAELAATVGPDTWRQWRYTWMATSGVHTLEARAADGTGMFQTDIRASGYPDGASGWPSTVINVT